MPHVPSCPSPNLMTDSLFKIVSDAVFIDSDCTNTTKEKNRDLAPKAKVLHRHRHAPHGGVAHQWRGWHISWDVALSMGGESLGGGGFDFGPYLVGGWGGGG